MPKVVARASSFEEQSVHMWAPRQKILLLNSSASSPVKAQPQLQRTCELPPLHGLEGAHCTSCLHAEFIRFMCIIMNLDQGAHSTRPSQNQQKMGRGPSNQPRSAISLSLPHTLRKPKMHIRTHKIHVQTLTYNPDIPKTCPNQKYTSGHQISDFRSRSV
jgi:hypothetical protein